MRTTIDGAGRIVVPKRLRDELGLGPGQEIEVALRNGRLEIEPVPVSMHLVKRKGVLVAEADVPMPGLSGEQVRDAQEHIRR